MDLRSIAHSALLLLCLCGRVAALDGLDGAMLGNLGNTDLMTTEISRTHAIITTIKLGTPPQEFRCMLDTGSSDIWVPSTRCLGCNGKRHFQANASSTFIPEETDIPGYGKHYAEVRLSYASKEVVGFKVQDTLEFGSITVKNQSFIIVESAFLPRMREWDGICGLGWNGLSKVDKPLYKRLQEQHRDAIFTMVPTGNRTAFMTVGGLPHGAPMPSTLRWVKAERDGLLPPAGAVSNPFDRDYWIVSGGLAIQKANATPAKFIVDSGTSQVMLIPPKHYMAFMRSLIPYGTFEKFCGADPRKGNLVICDCAILYVSMPPLRIYLDEHEFNISIPELFKYADPGKDDSERVCILQVQPNGLKGIGVRDGLFGGLLGDLLGLGGRLGKPLADGPVSKPLVIANNMTKPFNGSSGPEQIVDEVVSSLLGNKEANAMKKKWQSASIKNVSNSLLNNSHSLGGMMGGLFSNMSNPLTKITNHPLSQKEHRDAKHRQIEGRRLQLLASMPLLGEMASDPRERFWVLGGPFLERYVAVLDFDNERLGLAEPAGAVDASDTAKTGVVQNLLPSHENLHKTHLRLASTAGKIQHPQRTIVQEPRPGLPRDKSYQTLGAIFGVLGCVALACIALASAMYFRRPGSSKMLNRSEMPPSNYVSNFSNSNNAASGYKEDRHLLRSDTMSTIDLAEAQE